MKEMTPRQIVEQLDRFIIGQADAKRAVAVAIRNRWRRQHVEAEMAREVYPKNIVMSGPTGVGKTEIARRLAKLTGAPFIKVEASKFTEVGYHGRDVESMIRDLVEQAISMVRAEQAEHVTEAAREAANERLIDLLLPSPAGGSGGGSKAGESESAGPDVVSEREAELAESSQERRQRIRERLRQQLEAGKLEDREVELTIDKKPNTSAMFANMGLDQMDPEMSGMLEKLMPAQSRRQRTTVGNARRILTEQETEKRLDTEKITGEAIERAQDAGIVFLDEIDKIATPTGKTASGGGGGGGSPDVSRQGVQRDLLPIVEGSTVSTRHGLVQTDHILFIAAGAFSTASVSDLMPELQGRFPIRVELTPLGRDDFVRILNEPHNALTRQQQALLGVEGLEVSFDETAIEAIAELAARANASMENIGARRLMTVVEKLFEQVNFDAPDRVAAGEAALHITAELVHEQVGPVVEDRDLSKFVL